MSYPPRVQLAPAASAARYRGSLFLEAGFGHPWLTVAPRPVWVASTTQTLEVRLYAGGSVWPWSRRFAESWWPTPVCPFCR